MRAIRLAFGIKDQRYGKKLSEYLAVHPRELFTVTVFSDPAKLNRKKEQFDAVLAEEEFLSKKEKEIKAPVQILLRDQTASLEVKDFPGISMYQTVDGILKEVLTLLGDAVPRDSLYLGGKQVIAVFSPDGDRDQMLLSLHLAERLSKETRILYVNFCDFPGLSGYLGREFGKDLSELLYYSRQDAERFYGKLSTVIEQYNGFDLIPPAANPENLHEFTAEEYRNFFTKLCERTPYQTILIDFGFVLPGFLDLLKRCNAVLLPESGSALTEYRKKTFSDWFREPQEKLYPVQKRNGEFCLEGLPFLTDHSIFSGEDYDEG